MQKVVATTEVKTDKPFSNGAVPVYRSSKFDNIKGILIFLVVLCHMFELFGGGVRYSIYNAVYVFHMPVFVFVSGYFARFDIKRIAFRQIYPYIVFQILYCIAFANKIQFYTPYWILWYMFCLVIWCASLCIVKKKLPIWIAVAFAVALCIGYAGGVGSRFSLSRMICFYPFFLLGVYFRSKGVGIKKLKGEKHLGAAMLAGAVIVTCVILSHVKTNWLYHSMPYAETGCTALMRGAIFCAALLWCGGLLFLISEKNFLFVSDWGRYSICIYLIHGFVQRIFLNVYNPFTYAQWVNIVIAVLVTVAICFCCGNKHILYLIRPFADLSFFGDAIKKIKVKGIGKENVND